MNRKLFVSVGAFALLLSALLFWFPSFSPRENPSSQTTAKSSSEPTRNIASSTEPSAGSSHTPALAQQGTQSQAATQANLPTQQGSSSQPPQTQQGSSSGKVILDLSKYYGFVEGKKAHPRQLLAKLKHSEDAKNLDTLVAKLGLRVCQVQDLGKDLVLLALDESGIREVKSHHDAIENGTPIQTRLNALNASDFFEFVEPDYIMEAFITPTDAAYTAGTLWGLKNTTTPGADIDAERAWNITVGSKKVIVAVIDTGVRATHVDLKSQMWVNTAEIPANGKDDDNNGYIDDVNGINAIDGSGNPDDDNGHGTHCSGTIGASANDDGQHVGVAWNVSIMACKFLGSGGSGSTSDAVVCVNYATRMGAKILSNSWGGGGAAKSLETAIAAAKDAGVLFVAAAGNNASNNDTVDNYPSNYNVSNIVAVAALDKTDALAPFSNYGLTKVHVGAPGVSIFSCSNSSDTAYKTLSGTSMATPHVAGVASLLLAKFPSLSVDELKRRLTVGAVPIPALTGKCTTGGRVNAYNSLFTSPDGELELVVSPADGRALPAGRTANFSVYVTDLFAVTDATVVAVLPDGSNVTFKNDGVAPDKTAGDEVYIAALTPPTTSTSYTVQFAVTAPGKKKADISATYTLFLPPVNDLFTERTEISGTDVLATGNNTTATSETAEPQHTTRSAGRSVWWRWTAPSNGLVNITTNGSDFDTVLAVYTGSDITKLAKVASDDNGGDGSCSQVNFFAIAGTTYSIVVDTASGVGGAITLKLKLSQAPAIPDNDSFAKRQNIKGGTASATGSNIGATLETGEPDHTYGQGGHSVWYTWTAPYNGYLVVDTNGSSFDTYLAIYTGDTLGGLKKITYDNDSGDGECSRTSLSVTSGKTYQIAIDGYRGAMGAIVLNLTLSGNGSPEVNDNFAMPLSMGKTTSGLWGNYYTAYCSKEQDEPDHAGNSGGKSIWWSWTAPEDGTLKLNTGGSNFDTLLAVYTGNSLSTLKEVASNDNDSAGGVTSRLSCPVKTGTLYYIAIDGSDQGLTIASGLAWLNMEFISKDAVEFNDNFANAKILTGTYGGNSVSNAGASAESFEPNHGGHPACRSLWYRWTATLDGLVTVNTEYSNLDTTLGVYQGTSLETLKCIASDDNSGKDKAAKLSFYAYAGNTYYFAEDTANGATGFPYLFFSQTALSGSAYNDNFNKTSPWGADGSFLSTWSLSAGNNTYATKENGEPAHAGNAGGASLWQSIEARNEAVITLSLDGSDFDTLLAVYTGDSVDKLTLVAENNDHDSLKTSAVTFRAKPGIRYHVAIDGANGARGDTLAAMKVYPLVENDSFAKAKELTSGYTVFMDTLSATAEAGEPAHGSKPAHHSVWFKWTSTDGKPMRFSTVGSDFDTVMAIYEGNRVDQLVRVAANDDGKPGMRSSSIELQPAQGHTYYIAVDGSDTTSTGQLCLVHEYVTATNSAPYFGSSIYFLSGPNTFESTPRVGFSGKFTIYSVYPTRGTTIRWQRLKKGTTDWVDLGTGDFEGVMDLTLKINAFTKDMDGDQLRCAATNSFGTTYSNVYLLNVAEAPHRPIIVSQPQDFSFAVGFDVTFEIQATGDWLDYSWNSITPTGAMTYLTDGNNISGSRTSKLTIKNPTADQLQLKFSCFVSNTMGYLLTRDAAIVQPTLVKMIRQPADALLNKGSAKISVMISSASPLSYQWQTRAGSGSAWVDISDGGAYSQTSTDTLLITDPNNTLIGSAYRCRINNGHTQIFSRSSTLQAGTPQSPLITKQPSNISGAEGYDAVFSVTATGTPTPNYKWQYRWWNSSTWNTILNDDELFTGSSSNTLTLRMVDREMNSARIRCLVSNTYGTVTSEESSLTVNVPPFVAIQPQSAHVSTATYASFSLTYYAIPDPSYQWQYLVSGGAWTNVVDDNFFSGSLTSYLWIGDITKASGKKFRCILNNGFGTPTITDTVEVIKETADTIPVITTQPSPLTVTDGDTGTFGIAYTGCPNPSFQWQVKIHDTAIWRDIGGSSLNLGSSYGPVLRMTDISTYQNGDSFRCVVKNKMGSVTSQEVLLSVAAKLSYPTFSSNPSDCITTADSDATFTAVCPDTAAVSYTWQYRSDYDSGWTSFSDGPSVAGCKTATLTLLKVGPSMQNLQIQCVAKNTRGIITSDTALLFVKTPPSIIEEPADTKAYFGLGAKLAVKISGMAPLYYQWMKNGTAIAGANSDTLSLAAVNSADAGNYSVLVGNGVGSVRSRTAVLTTQAMPISPTFTLNPQNCAIAAGADATFKAEALATPAPSHEWQLSTNAGATWTSIPEGGTYAGTATTALVVKAATANMNAFQYRCKAANSSGTAYSTAAVLTIDPPPVITSQPAGQTLLVGSRLTLNVVASGAGTLSYQWKKNGAILSGANSATYTIASVTMGDAGSYTVVVTGAGGSVESSQAGVIISDPGRMSALAVRSICGDGDKLMIVGYALSGSSKKTMIVRGLGPNLVKQGVPEAGVLKDPVIRVFTLQGQEIAMNDDWNGDPSLSFSYAPLDKGTKDAALSVDLNPGVYSASVFGKNNTSGDSMIEIYDSTPNDSSTRFTALSLRTQLAPGQTIMPGLVISGSTTRKLIIRVLGPALATVDNSLVVHPDPKLAIYSNGQRIIENDDWSGDYGAAIGLTPFLPGSKDPSIVASLSPGVYSITVSGNGTKGGIILVEIYEMP